MLLGTSLLAVGFFITTGHCSPIPDPKLSRARRDVDYTRLSPGDRPSCKPNSLRSLLQVNTTDQLAQLRALFHADIDAYIIPSEDAHSSEYPSSYDLRRGYISGFSGSAGIAVVTRNKAALWTDGRYFLEAEDALDCNWILMKSGEAGVPTTSQWLIQEIKAINSTYRVGASPFLISSSSWQSYVQVFGREGINITKVDPELVDQIWTTGRPPAPNSTINALPIEFAGKNWEDKIADLRTDLQTKGAAAFVVTSLDETAWLFNARASDISYNPFFISYAIVEQNRIRLYIKDALDKLRRSPSDKETTVNLASHLSTSSSGSCANPSASLCVEVIEYDPPQVVTAIQQVASQGKVWVSYSCNFAIFDAIPSVNRIQDRSTVALRKSMKNAVEREGMRQSHIRDAVALVTFMAKLEKEVKEGKIWDEISAAQELAKSRSQQQYNRGLSFGSISAVGPNGAVIHYSPTPETNRNITTEEVYLLDSGGQYLDGTTDVTRTFHFGTPTAYQKECYTRVLMGHIDLAMAKWPRGLYGKEIDALARSPLWDAGLIYRHGTGHGIGAYLSVHEGPGRIALSSAVNPSEEYLREYMFFSDEPGYYQDNQFGIRIETIVMVDFVNTTYNYQNATFLGFEFITVVPMEPNLINLDLLNKRQLDWLNSYHQRVRALLSPGLQNDPLALAWVEVRTRPMGVGLDSSSGPTLSSGSLVFLGLLTVFLTISYEQPW